MSALNLVGGSYRARSPNFEASRTVNLYPEQSHSGQSKGVAMLVGTPGLRLFAQIPDYPIRGVLRVTADLALVVAGAGIYPVYSNGFIGTPGTISRASTMVSLASNGQEVMIVDGSATFYVVKITSKVAKSFQYNFSFTPQTDPSYVGADKVDFVDGYFIFNKTGTQEYQITAQYDTTIDPLDFASAEGSPDLLISLIVDHSEVWLFGQDSTEVHYDSGDSSFPFQRIQGAFIEQGCAAKNSVAKMDNTVIWLAADDRGQGIVVKAQGYTPIRISDHALEYAIASYGNISDAEAYTYMQEGHLFYVLTFPSGNATWAYDAATQLWHQRAWLNPNSGRLDRHRSRCHMAFAGKNIVGDWQNGNLYSLELDEYTDNGDILPAIRQTPHSANGNTWQFFSKLWVDVEAGVGTLRQSTTQAYTGWNMASTTLPTMDDNTGTYTMNQGATQTTMSTERFPALILEWSDDGGHSFGNRRVASLGKIGERRARANFRRLGKSRDRVWRLSITDPVKRILIGGDVEVSVGS